MLQLFAILYLVIFWQSAFAQRNVEDLDKEQRINISTMKLKKVQIGNRRNGFAYFKSRESGEIYSVEIRGLDDDWQNLSDSTVLTGIQANFRNNTLFRVHTTYRKSGLLHGSILYLENDSVLARKDLKETFPVDIPLIRRIAYELLGRAKVIDQARSTSN